MIYCVIWWSGLGKEPLFFVFCGNFPTISDFLGREKNRFDFSAGHNEVAARLTVLTAIHRERSRHTSGLLSDFPVESGIDFLSPPILLFEGFSHIITASLTGPPSVTLLRKRSAALGKRTKMLQNLAANKSAACFGVQFCGTIKVIEAICQFLFVKVII